MMEADRVRTGAATCEVKEEVKGLETIQAGSEQKRRKNNWIKTCPRMKIPENHAQNIECYRLKNNTRK